MSTAHTIGQVVQYRNVGKFEILEISDGYTTEQCSYLKVRQLTGSRTKAMKLADTDVTWIWQPRA